MYIIRTRKEVEGEFWKKEKETCLTEDVPCVLNRRESEMREMIGGKGKFNERKFLFSCEREKEDAFVEEEERKNDREWRRRRKGKRERSIDNDKKEQRRERGEDTVERRTLRGRHRRRRRGRRFLKEGGSRRKKKRGKAQQNFFPSRSRGRHHRCVHANEIERETKRERICFKFSLFYFKIIF